MWNEQRPYMNATDEDAAKLKFKLREEQLHKRGPFPFFKNIVDLLIAVGVLAALVMFGMFVRWL